LTTVLATAQLKENTLKTPGQIAYEAAAKATDCNQPWSEANQSKWNAAAEAVATEINNGYDSDNLQDWLKENGFLTKQRWCDTCERYVLAPCNSIDCSIPEVDKW